MPYWNQLYLLAQWYVQLWAESLGKNKAGFTPIAALGTLDQHSVLQLMKEGPNNKLVGFLDVDSFEEIAIKKPAFQVSPEFEYLFKHHFNLVTHGALQATQKSLSNSDVPTYLLTLKNVSEESLGAFFFFHETACAIAGELYGIDAFDQPGVEESKKLLKAILA